MKRLSFFAICASVIVASCTVSNFSEAPIENAGGDEICTVIGATILDTKASFGTPDGNTYPVVWQAGDKINVNGAESYGLVSDNFDGQSAEFAFSSELSAPYKAVYPASAVKSFGETTKILVPLAQEYVANNYDPAAGIMLGTGNGGIQFAGAMAFLKVRTTGASDVKIARVEVTSLGSEKMAGDFVTTDFATMAPDASGNSFSGVSITPATPVDAGTTFIVAVPAQTYASGFMVSFQTPDGKVMQKKSEKSFAALAGHMYAFTIEVVPVAVEGTVTIDGSFTDWQTVPAVSYSLPAKNPSAPNIMKMSLTADDDFVYGYVEMDETYPSYGTFMDIFVDSDANVETGGKLGSIEAYTGVPFTDSGLEWYIEGGCYDLGTGGYYDWFAKYHYYGMDGNGIFSALENLSSTISSDGFALTGSSNNKGLGRFEFKMARDIFGLYGTKSAFGIKNILNSRAAGLLPQGESVGEDFVRIAMGAITMNESSHKPAPAPVGGIVMDGDFSDWDDIEGLSANGSMPLQVLQKAKFAADETYLYVYLELADVKAHNSAGDDNCMMDFYIDCDGNPATGGIRSDVFNHGVNWYYETFICDNTTIGSWNSGQYEYNGADGGSIWSLTNHGGEYIVVTRGVYDSAVDGFKIEARLSRKDFKLINTRAAFGVVVMEGSTGGWPAMGKLPQNNDLSMYVMDLPEYVEE